jgi:hypothetical protein
MGQISQLGPLPVKRAYGYMGLGLNTPILGHLGFLRE